jgi:long-chain fatty acid transport protein
MAGRGGRTISPVPARDGGRNPGYKRSVTRCPAQSRRTRTTLLAWAAVLGALFTGGEARANPLSFGRFDGHWGDAASESAWALYWNPAGLARPGLSAGFDLQIITRQASFTRDAGANGVTPDERAANAGKSTSSAGGTIPSIAARWGTTWGDFDVGTGLGVYIGNGGTVTWDKNLKAPSQYPGAVDGPQRWAGIKGGLIIFEASAGLAAKHNPTGLSFGVAPVIMISRFETVRALNVDGSDDLVDSSGRLKEGRVHVQASSVDFRFVAGARWDKDARNAVSVAYSRGVTLILEGPLDLTIGAQAPSAAPTTSYFDMPIPDTVRAAGKIGLGDRVTLRPSVEWSRFSVLDNQSLRVRATDERILLIPRDYGDGYAGRLRGDLRVNERLMLGAGVGYEITPTPTRTMEPGFGEANSLELSAAGRYRLSDHVSLGLTAFFTHFFQLKVKDSITRPTMNGTYREERESFLFDVEVRGWTPSDR